MEITHPDEIQRFSLGDYSNILIQCYLVYTTIYRKTVFFFKFHTKIDWYTKKKHGFHYYLGEDLTYFNHPDMKLFDIGMLLSELEFEIIKLVGQGLSSEQIAEEIFLSINTLYIHHCNMLTMNG